MLFEHAIKTFYKQVLKFWEADSRAAGDFLFAFTFYVRG